MRLLPDILSKKIFWHNLWFWYQNSVTSTHLAYTFGITYSRLSGSSAPDGARPDAVDATFAIIETFAKIRETFGKKHYLCTVL
jgi:hypothetical protein